MTDSLFEVVASATRELTKYGFSTQEFATLVQQHNMTDVEVLAVAKVFDYLLEKRERSTVEFLLRTSRLPKMCIRDRVHTIYKLLYHVGAEVGEAHGSQCGLDVVFDVILVNGAVRVGRN